MSSEFQINCQLFPLSKCVCRGGGYMQMCIYITQAHTERYLVYGISLFHELHSLIHLREAHRGLSAIFECFWGYVRLVLLPLSFIASHSSASSGLPLLLFAHCLHLCPSEKTRWRTEIICEMRLPEYFYKPLTLCCGFCFFLWWIFKTVFRTPVSRVTVSALYGTWWSQWAEDLMVVATRKFKLCCPI